MVALVPAALFVLCLVRILEYGLTWDEPTYFRFARFQADWIADLIASIFEPAKLEELLSAEQIRRVWLQHPLHNGHPPLHETWMGLIGRFFALFGASDLASMRASIALLFALVAALFYRFLRGSMGAIAALCGALLLAGVPAIWAHAHLGATEIMQCFLWVALALALPKAMRGRRRSVALWGALCALAFACKFTNVLAIGWVLGASAVLGGWRERRLWMLASVGVASALLGLLILDPYFWPWQGGVGRYLDYLRQCVSRAEWIPISVFYQGRNWGFDPPWHYRIVETVTTLPLPTLLLFAIGSWFGLASFWRQLRRQSVEDWPSALGLTALGITLVTGLFPGAPNHDITRQFVFVYLAVAILSAAAVERLISSARRFQRDRGRRAGLVMRVPPNLVALAAVVTAITSFLIAMSAEPFGLGYRNALLGGARGAWDRGFEISYWGEAITPDLLQSVDTLRLPDGSPPRIFSIPKLNYFGDAEELWKPLVVPETAERERLAIDAMPAFHERWVTASMRERQEEALRVSFRTPIDGILFFWRRGSVASSYEGLLSDLEKSGDLRLVAETRLGGVPVGRLYEVERMSRASLDGDPEQRTWYRLGDPTRAGIEKTSGQPYSQ